MAKRRSRRGRKAKPVGGASSAKAGSAKAGSKPGAFEYWLAKGLQAFKRGDAARVEHALSRALPDGDPTEGQLRALVVRWPTAAMHWWDRFDEAVWCRCFEAAVFQWDAPRAEAVVGGAQLPAEWRVELRALREALPTVCEAEYDAGRKALKAVGRRGQFPDAARFLRGLLVWRFQGDAERAQALGGFEASSPFAPVAEALRVGAAAVTEPGRRCAELLDEVDPLRLTNAFLAKARGGLPGVIEHAYAKLVPQVSESLARLVRREVCSFVDVDKETELAWQRAEERAEALRSAVSTPAELVGDHLQAHARRVYKGALDPASPMDATILSSMSLADAQIAVAVALLAIVKVEQDQVCDCERCERDRAKELAARIRALEAAVVVDPSFDPAWRMLLEACEEAGDGRGGSRVAARYVKAMPKSLGVALLVAWRALGRGALDAAFKYASHAARLAPLDRRVVELQIDTLLGKALKKGKAGRMDVAKTLLEKAFALDGLSPRDRARLLAERAVLARIERRKSSPIDKTTPYPWFSVICAERRLRAYAGARRRLAWVSPKSPPTREDLVLCAESECDPRTDPAEVHMEKVMAHWSLADDSELNIIRDVGDEWLSDADLVALAFRGTVAAPADLEWWKFLYYALVTRAGSIAELELAISRLNDEALLERFPMSERQILARISSRLVDKKRERERAHQWSMDGLRGRREAAAKAAAAKAAKAAAAAEAAAKVAAAKAAAVKAAAAKATAAKAAAAKATAAKATAAKQLSLWATGGD